jgi:small subunit ribosomal protein S2
LDYFRRQRKGLEEGAFGQYTKRERLLLEREVEKMSAKFAGLEDFTTVPDVIFLIDSSIKSHTTALHEARVKGIPVVAIIDNDDDPNDFAYFIPANDHSRLSIEWVINMLITKLQS